MKINEINCTTGEVVVRDMTKAELDAHKAWLEELQKEE